MKSLRGFLIMGIVPMAVGLVAATRTVKFVKYHGIGNDFIIVDNRGKQEPILTKEEAVKVCNRNMGVGGDGVLFVMGKEDGKDLEMRIYNSDGSEPEMCGNGIRCIRKYLHEYLDGPKGAIKINTLAGIMTPDLLDNGRVRVAMGKPIFKPEDIPTLLSSGEERVEDADIQVDGQDYKVTCVSMGNPHAIVFVDKLDDIDLPTVGPKFEKHPVFPNRINTEFVQVKSRQHLLMKVWERGAGPTLACGTGACALVVAAAITGRADPACTVSLPGGDLEIEWSKEEDGGDGQVYMTGPADFVFEGNLNL